MSQNFVTSYLKNFFADASEDQINNYFMGLDNVTKEIMTMLIKTNMQSQQAVSKFAKLQQEQPTKSAVSLDQKQLEDDLITIRSSTYNARFYIISKEITKRWNDMKQPISRNKLFIEMGQDTPIKAFDEALLYGDTATKTGQAIHRCFQQYYRDEDIFIFPTEYGTKVFEFDQEYYSKNSIIERFNSTIRTGWFSKRKYKLLKELAINTYTNSIKDKQKLGEICGLHPDNISRAITKFTQLGFIERIPVRWESKHFRISVFVQQKIIPRNE